MNARKRKEWVVRREAHRNFKAMSQVTRRLHTSVKDRNGQFAIDADGDFSVGGRYFHILAMWRVGLREVLMFLDACPYLWPQINALSGGMAQDQETIDAELEKAYTRISGSSTDTLVRPTSPVE